MDVELFLSMLVFVSDVVVPVLFLLLGCVFVYYYVKKYYEDKASAQRFEELCTPADDATWEATAPCVAEKRAKRKRSKH